MVFRRFNPGTFLRSNAHAGDLFGACADSVAEKGAPAALVE
jgi:hypothetical protein